MNKGIRVFSIICLLLLLIVGIVRMVIILKDQPTMERKEKEMEITVLAEHQRALQDSVAELEAKARILNNYLHAKHLEYIDVCNLVEQKSK